MLVKTVSYLLWFTVTSGVLRFQQAVLDPNEIDLVECTIQIGEKYSEFRKIILVREDQRNFESEGTLDEITYLSNANLLAKMNLPLIVTDRENLNNLQGLFIIFAPTIHEPFTEIFSEIRMWKSNRFVVVLLAHHNENIWDLQHLFFQFLKNHIINVVVLMHRRDGVYVYDCHPFSKNITLADIWHRDSKQFKKEANLFDDDAKVKDLHGFNMECLTKNKPPDSVLYQRNGHWVSNGLGVNLLWEVSKKMNFTPNIVFPVPESQQNVDRFGYDISQFMNSAIIGSLTLREADLAFGVFSQLLYVSPNTEFSTTAAEECFTFAVPAFAGRPQSMWSDFINEFQTEVWILLAVTFVLNALVWYMVSTWQLYMTNDVEPLCMMKSGKEVNAAEDTRRHFDEFSDKITYTDNYQSPLSLIKACIKKMRSKYLLASLQKQDIHEDTDKANPHSVFKNNYRRKVELMLADAKKVLPRKKISARGFSQTPGKQRITFMQVIFFKIALSLGIPSLNKVGNGLVLKFLFMQYVLFCLITSQAYLGSLGSFMTYPNERAQISSPEELYDLKLALLGVPQSKRILERATSTRDVLRKLGERFVAYRGVYDDLLLKMHLKRNISTFATTRFLQFYINNNPALKSNPGSIYMMPECTVTSQTSPFLFQRGSPFIDPVNKILFRIVESGITKKWYDSSSPRKVIPTRDPIKQLDLNQIMGCFVMLLVLHGISILVFILEVIVFERQNRTFII